MKLKTALNVKKIRIRSNRKKSRVFLTFSRTVLSLCAQVSFRTLCYVVSFVLDQTKARTLDRRPKCSKYPTLDPWEDFFMDLGMQSQIFGIFKTILNS